MEFEWDPAKAEANVRKHDVSFDEATGVFLDPRVVVRYDQSHSETEDRWKAVGFSTKGRLLSVIYTRNGDDLRIISSRKASSREKRTYNEAES